MPVAANVICLWTGTNASIPANWSRETTLDARYPKGTAAAVDPGGTGGANTHSHTTTAHDHAGAHVHTIPNSGDGASSSNRDSAATNPPVAHTHVSNPNTVNPTEALATDTPAAASANSEPANFVVIFIKSDGTPVGLPDGAVALWNSASPPTGWNLCDGGGTPARPDMRLRFLKGAAAAGDGGGTGGGDHSHTIASHTHGGNYSHSHPNVTSSTTATALTTGSISGAQVGVATSNHTHVLTVATQATDAITGNTDSAVSAAGNSEPPFTAEGYLQNNNGAVDLPTNIICLWVGTLASIPSSWVLCDGGTGTPDLRGQFVKGANTLAGVGATGGSLTHNHTASGHTHPVAAHTHTVTAATGAGENRTAGAVAAAVTAHTHPSWSPTGSASLTSGSGTPVVDNYTDTQPAFTTVAFIQYQPSTTTERGWYVSCPSGGWW